MTYHAKTLLDLPASPFVAPWIKPIWHNRITVETAPGECRIHGRTLQGPCWLWHGATNGKGHGRVFIRPVPGKDYGVYLHRLSLAAFHGIDIGQLDAVDHLCRRRNCFQPLHVESVTPIENYLRGDGPKYQFKAAEPANDITDEDLQALIRGY